MSINLLSSMVYSMALLVKYSFQTSCLQIPAGKGVTGESGVLRGKTPGLAGAFFV
jgi:hypothetical protein